MIHLYGTNQERYLECASEYVSRVLVATFSSREKCMKYVAEVKVGFQTYNGLLSHFDGYDVVDVPHDPE